MKGLCIEMKIPFGGNVLLLGCGSVSQCFQPLLMRHLEMDFSKLTIIDFEDLRHTIPDVLAAGANYVRHRINADNYAETFAQYLRPGDLLIDLAWNIDTVSAIRWCHDHDVLYVNTSVELWDPYEHMGSASPTASTLYVRQLALEALAASWSEPGATSVVDHGANPGLVSHWTKLALEDIAKALINQPDFDPQRRSALEQAYTEGAYNRLAMLTGVKVIHISERDTQISDKPKRVDEFVNTWSIEGFYEEGVAPAEMGWGTHERTLPRYAYTHDNGRGNQICLARMGMNTFVRSWVPQGEILGMVIRHGEAYTISDHLTVWEDGKAIYRPTVHYAYMPCDAAIASLHELRMNNYKPQSQVRIMTNEIVDGRDELGVLLLGHDLNGWWVGSQLDIHEARMLVPGQNATTLQVAASVLAAVVWMLRNPRRGFNVPDNLPHREVLEIANPYLGPCPSMRTDWTPLKNRYDAFPGYGAPRPADEDVWQFSTFLFE
jgi:homospermidine synthase